MGDVIHFRRGKITTTPIPLVKLYYVINVKTGQRALPKTYGNVGHAKLAFRCHIGKARWADHAIAAITGLPTPVCTLDANGDWAEVGTT